MSPAPIRPARPTDVPAIVAMIRELAEFEKLSHQLELTEEQLARDLFDERPVIEALVADGAEGPAGYALFFRSYSTFLGRPGLWLEDLYVKPSARRAGLGRRLLAAVAELTVSRGYGRFEWSVLDWNTSAIAFYESEGALVLPDWRICRVTGPALTALAARAG
jgi:GNAT superfamily N-acetyltransferase